MQKSVASDDARRAWGELLDSALAGEAVEITRRNRPIAVVINAKQWHEALTNRALFNNSQKLLALYQTIAERERTGTTITDEERQAERRQLNQFEGERHAIEVAARIARGEEQTYTYEEVLAAIAEQRANGN